MARASLFAASLLLAAPLAQAQLVQTQTTAVHIAGPPNIVVEMRGQGNSWAEVCRGACDRDLPREGSYRITGPGVRTSETFSVYRQERAKLGVTTASSTAFGGGLGLVIGGYGVLAHGIGFFVAASVDNQLSQGTHDAFLIVGAVLTGVGAIAGIIGALVLINNLHTEVSGMSTNRFPAWREFPTTQPASRFGAITFPALSGTF